MIMFWLCCKDSLLNAADRVDCILLSLGSHSKQGSDEYHLTPGISFLHTVYVPFSHHIDHFVSLQRSPCRFKREEAKPWFDQPHEEAMFLLNTVVEILDLPSFTALGHSSLGFQFVQSLGIGGVFIHRYHTRMYRVRGAKRYTASFSTRRARLPPRLAIRWLVTPSACWQATSAWSSRVSRLRVRRWLSG
jgi:hypothetical protein